jgi:predicted DNA-binding protein
MNSKTHAQVRIERALAQRLKILAIRQDRTLTDVLKAAVSAYLSSARGSSTTAV